MTIRVDGAGHKLILDNPTPWHVTVSGLATGPDKTTVKIDPVMVAPMSQLDVPVKSPISGKVYLTHVNDYGGQSEVEYACEAELCRSVEN
jgi:fimbrial chaperone protein